MTRSSQSIALCFIFLLLVRQCTVPIRRLTRKYNNVQKKFASFSVSERKFQCENQHADLAIRAGSQRGATLLSGHKEDLLGSLEVLVVLIGE